MERKNNNGIFYVVISLVAVLGIAGSILAFSGSNTGNVFEGDCNNCDLTDAPKVDVAQEPTLGAFAGTNIVVDDLEYGDSASRQLNFSAGSPTTTGSFGNLYNFGPAKLCDLAEVNLTATGEKVAYSGMTISLSTSTSPTTFSSGFSGSLIASTTQATSTAATLNTVRHVGRTGTGPWTWATGEYLITAASFSDTRASSTDYSLMSGKMYVRCHVR